MNKAKVVGIFALALCPLPLAWMLGATGIQPAGDSVSVVFPNGASMNVVGIDGGTPLNVNVTNSLSVANASVGTVGSATPTSATAIGGTDGTNLRIPSVDSTNLAVYVSPIATTYAGGAATKTAVTTTTAAHTGMTANSCLRIMCDIDIFWLTGTGTPTALTTSNPLPAKTVEKFCMTGSATAIAYITGSGSGSCYDSIIPLHP